jgi:hypothetical protein
MIWIVGREMDGQACEGSRRVERERTSQILRRTYGNQTYYFQQDHNYNVTHLTSAAGAVIEKYGRGKMRVEG